MKSPFQSRVGENYGWEGGSWPRASCALFRLPGQQVEIVFQLLFCRWSRGGFSWEEFRQTLKMLNCVFSYPGLELVSNWSQGASMCFFKLIPPTLYFHSAQQSECVFSLSWFLQLFIITRPNSLSEYSQVRWGYGQHHCWSRTGLKIKPFTNNCLT